MGAPVRSYPRVLITSTTAGSGPLQLSNAAVTGYENLAEAGAVDGDTVTGVVQDSLTAPDLWMRARGIIALGSIPTFTPTVIFGRKGDGNQPVSWPTTGTRYVFFPPMPEHQPSLDTDGLLLTTVIPPTVLPHTRVLFLEGNSGPWTGDNGVLTNAIPLVNISLPARTRRVRIGGWARGAMLLGGSAALIFEVIAKRGDGSEMVGRVISKAAGTADSPTITAPLGGLLNFAAGQVETGAYLQFTVRRNVATGGGEIHIYDYAPDVEVVLD